MNGKSSKMRRRLSVVGLAASIAAVAVSAAGAGGNHQAGLVASKLGSPDPRDSELLVLNVPSMDGVILHKSGREHRSDLFPRADDQMFRAIIEDAAQEHGAAGFGNTTDAVGVLRTTPRLVAPDYSHLPTGDRP